MTIHKPEVEEKIKEIILKLELEEALIPPTIDLYRKAVGTAYVAMTKIRDISMALASVYITMRLYSTNPVTQDVFSYHYKVSTATLRKTYGIICNVLNIDRTKIVGERTNMRNEYDEEETDAKPEKPAEKT
jgi:transcription initiation factor TFIIIB Brf1 subunit/transcription initiation factor TFIIB